MENPFDEDLFFVLIILIDRQDKIQIFYKSPTPTLMAFTWLNRRTLT